MTVSARSVSWVERKFRAVSRAGAGVVLADGEDVGHGLAGVPSADEAQNGVLEGVVHHAVEALAQQVGAALVEAELGGGVLPHFAQKKLIRADPLDGGTHFSINSSGSSSATSRRKPAAPRRSQVSMTPPSPVINST